MDVLERIKEAIRNGKECTKKDWEYVFEHYNLRGSSDAETIQNVQKFVSDNFSFASPDAKSAYVYFGNDGNVAMWQIIDDICKITDGSMEYISSTEAGKLFNDEGFYIVLREILETDSLIEMSGNEDTGNISTGSADNVEIMVDSMTNLVIDGMSEVNCDNVINIIDNSTNINSDNNVQLWVAK